MTWFIVTFNNELDSYLIFQKVFKLRSFEKYAKFNFSMTFMLKTKYNIYFYKKCTRKHLRSKQKLLIIWITIDEH